MGLLKRLKDSIGEEGGGAAEQEPSHRCESCGEEYYTDPATEIRECRTCGGINVEPV